MRRNLHAFGDARVPITVPGSSVSHAIVMADGSTYIRLFPSQTQRVLAAASATNAIFGTPVAAVQPLQCPIGQCAQPTSPVPLTQTQFNAVLAELSKIQKEAKSMPTGQRPIVLRVNTVAQQSTKSVLQPNASQPVHGSFATDPTMSTRPRAVSTNSSAITDGTPVPDPALITNVGQQSIDPAFANPQLNLVAGDQTGPTGPLIPITIPNLPGQVSVSTSSTDNKILGMEPAVAAVVGVGVAVALWVLLKK